MRGGRGPSSSSAGVHQLSRMSLRKQIIKDVHSESRQTDEDTQEDEAAADGDDKDELSASLLPASSAREQRWKGRENKPKPNEMTEEEMMALALRLSEQEASVSALRRRQEEEEVMKAIEESMVDQSQPDQDSQSQTLLRLCPRRKLSYSNGKKSETNLNSGAGNKNNRNNKRTRKAGSPLLEMPDLSQKICSQASASSSESLSAHPDSPQSSDSTQIDDLQLRRSPVFPSTGGRAEVHVSRLTQDQLDSCKNSGFVLCSQDSWASTQIQTQPKSPTFPQSSPDRSPVSSDKSPVSSDKSPVFGRNPQPETSPSACKPLASACGNSGFTLSSQDSLSATARPSSPVFLSERLPNEPPRGPAEPSRGRSGSPVFGRTGTRQEKSDIPSVSREVGNGDAGLVEGFAVSSQSSHSDEPKVKPKDWKCSESELTSDMTLVLSDEDEDVTQVEASPSPVFPGERPSHRAESQTVSLNHLEADFPETSCSLNPQRCDQSCSNRTPGASSSRCCSSGGAVSGGAVSRSGDPAGGPTVHYYWGVPFCPRGLDPNAYTKVILAQMEVYEKSLKQAQRSLMRKAEWGGAVLPQPEKSPSPELLPESPQHQAPQRRGVRLRGQKLSEAAESLPAEAEEEEEERGEKENTEEEQKNDGDEEPVDVDDCQVCPETQLSDVTQDLMKDDRTEVCPQPPPESSDSPEVEMILQEDPPTADEPQEEEMEVDAPAEGNSDPVDSKDSGEQTVRPEEDQEDQEDQIDPDVEEVSGRGLQRSESPELEVSVVPRSSEAAVVCPLCQTSFPSSRIEMHAAFCDGEAADRRRPAGSHASLKPQRKRTRRAEATPDETNDPSSSGQNQEKCYICQKNIPLRDYSRHTELCFQRRPAKTRGNLLSALEQTETRDSGAGSSGSRAAAGDVIDLRDEDEEEKEEEVSAFRISDSPIRSFTSISEATDCLVDFRKQRRAAKPSRRRR